MTVLFHTEGKDEATMATKVFHIELRCPGVTDPKKLEAIQKAAVIHARNLYGAAVLVTGDDTMPAIACYSEDFMTGQEDILKTDNMEEAQDD